jgi:hypothetical protein
MEVLKTISHTLLPEAPKAYPKNSLPSSRMIFLSIVLFMFISRAEMPQDNGFLKLFREGRTCSASVKR